MPAKAILSCLIGRAVKYGFSLRAVGRSEVTLLHKYELYFEPFVRRMVDGVFEGSNDPHFNRKDTLFIIKEFPGAALECCTGK